MEEDLRTLSGEAVTRAEAANYSPLMLAFLGDAVYELVIRSILVREGNQRPDVINRRKAALVRAQAQSAMIDALEGELTAEEASIVRRGRNAKSHTMAKNASPADYRKATAFEALIGYLSLIGDNGRIIELIKKGMERYGRPDRGQKPGDRGHEGRADG